MIKKALNAAAAALFLVCAPGALADNHGDIAISLMAVGVNVADLDRAEKFYSEVFELERTFQFPPEGTPIEIGLGRLDGSGGATLILAKFSDDPLPDGKKAYGRLIFNVSNADAIAERAEKRGATLRHVGERGPGNPVIIFFDDPDGYDVELYQAP